MHQISGVAMEGAVGYGSPIGRNYFTENREISESKEFSTIKKENLKMG